MCKGILAGQELLMSSAFLVSWMSILRHLQVCRYLLFGCSRCLCRTVSDHSKKSVLVGPVSVYCDWVFLPSMLFPLHFTLKPSLRLRIRWDC